MKYRGESIMKQRLKPVCLLACLLLCLAMGQCLAEGNTFSLPASLREIGEEAFMNTTAAEYISIQEGTEIIHSRAFAGSYAQKILLPASIMYIADDAFEGCTGVTVLVHRDSYAHMWASTHFIDYEVIGGDDEGEIIFEVSDAQVISETDETGAEQLCLGVRVTAERDCSLHLKVYDHMAGSYLPGYEIPITAPMAGEWVQVPLKDALPEYYMIEAELLDLQSGSVYAACTKYVEKVISVKVTADDVPYVGHPYTVVVTTSPATLSLQSMISSGTSIAIGNTYTPHSPNVSVAKNAKTWTWTISNVYFDPAASAAMLFIAADQTTYVPSNSFAVKDQFTITLSGAFGTFKASWPDYNETTAFYDVTMPAAEDSTLKCTFDSSDGVTLKMNRNGVKYFDVGDICDVSLPAGTQTFLGTKAANATSEDVKAIIFFVIDGGPGGEERTFYITVTILADERSNTQKALDYALQYNGNHGGYNSAYPAQTGGDCVNFVSQCVYAGGIPQSATWKPYTSAWVGTGPFIRYFGNTLGYPVYVRSNVDLTNELKVTKAGNVSASIIRPGDILFSFGSQPDKGGYEYGHAMIAVRVAGNYVYYCAHTADECACSTHNDRRLISEINVVVQMQYP